MARHGHVVLRESFGLMDVAAATPLADNALFRIYSMTKPLTCVAALVCYEMGCYELDDPVSRYLPEFEGTLHFRLSHSFIHTNLKSPCGAGQPLPA
eukprot:COSAG03_NODE_580_length_6871_cov_10.166716_6_plen_96_part_00